jgi:hypothetical protein
MFTAVTQDDKIQIAGKLRSAMEAKAVAASFR